ncbi:Uu.00g043320.m01.CDS01 [Anthostomella pinea]|uniref:Uu.00g043320.m01.CDS01 n=1 Tax=Anthostomella pinea TaxID=933095 RepID=A0AAI8YBT5_9PEZI|nr:Uu.00g043320.m01.CDS01 [Anthostomella pinea]
MRGTFRKNLFVVPKSVEYVKFDLINRRKTGAGVGNYEKISIPSIKDVMAGEYAFSPCPPSIGSVPIQSHLFMHSFIDPGDHIGQKSVMRLPKKVGKKLICRGPLDHDTALLYGWGIYIVEELNEEAVAYFLTVVMVIILAVTMPWSSVKQDTQGGMGIGQFALAFTALFLTMGLISMKIMMA